MIGTSCEQHVLSIKTACGPLSSGVGEGYVCEHPTPPVTLTLGNTHELSVVCSESNLFAIVSSEMELPVDTGDPNSLVQKHVWSPAG